MYFEKENDKIIKYSISLNEQELKRLRLEIIKKGSEISNIDKETTNVPKITDEHIINFRKNKIGIQCYNDNNIKNKVLYRVQYDYYKFPILIEYIDRLLNKDYIVIKDLFNTISQIQSYKAQKTISKQITTFYQMDNCSIKEYSKTIEELKSLSLELTAMIKQINQNENKESIDKYYERVKDCISFEKEDELSIIDYEKVLSFFSEKKDTNTYQKNKSL